MTSTASRRMLATALGLAATRVVPPLADDVHPVARFGSTMQRVEGALYADTRAAGVLYAGTGAALGAISGRSTGSVTAVVAVCAAGPQLRATAGAVADRLEAGDVDGARDVLPALVPSSSNPRACAESIGVWKPRFSVPQSAPNSRVST